MSNLDKIRYHYFLYDEFIRESYPKSRQYSIPIFAYDDLTRIEMNVYDLINAYNLPLLRQYPVKNYFLDFGDPVQKIAIEVDGEAFHKDKVKDSKRQKEIESEGWKFYRIKGKNTFWTIDDYYKKLTGDEFDEAETEELNKFVKENIELNSDCLILYLRNEYYLKYQIADSEHKFYDASEIAQSVWDKMSRLDERKKEWEKKYGQVNF